MITISVNDYVKENHLVDFTLTAQIFDIFIRPKYTWFNQYIFKGDWKCWNDKFSFLTRLRNPVAHNNSFDKLDKEIEIAREYCQEIKNAIIEYEGHLRKE